jgi:hypothetical protein
MTREEGYFVLIILQTTSVFASKTNPTQLTKPVNAHENCPHHVKTRGLQVKTGSHLGYIPTQKVQVSVLVFPPNPYSGIAVKVKRGSGGAWQFFGGP